MAGIKVRIEAVIFDNSNRLLLANHRKNNASYWVLPGGKIEFGETIEAALKRELYEELNLKNVIIGRLLAVDQFIDNMEKRHIIKIAYSVQVNDQQLNNVRLHTHSESIQGVHLFFSHEIVNSTDTFYPSKQFFLNLFKNISK